MDITDHKENVYLLRHIISKKSLTAIIIKVIYILRMVRGLSIP